MLLKQWDNLPDNMKTEEVRFYYDILKKKKISLILKRILDIILASIMIALFALPMIIISFLIVVDSKGGALYRQERVTSYGKVFRIHKFRTMVSNADSIGSQVTVGQDSRITKIGAFLRKYRLDEIPQLFDVISGNMSYVGTRPEVPKYVYQYSNDMMATLLLPAGITSEASIRFKDEAELLDGEDDVDKAYIVKVLPKKMEYNLNSIQSFSFVSDIATMIRTVFAVLGLKNYNEDSVNDDEKSIHSMHN